MKNYEANIKRIMEVLLSDPRYFTLDFIAGEVAISKRSVQNYLANVDSWIENNGLLHTQIIRKPGQGVFLYTDAMDRLKIEKLLQGKSFSIHGDDNRRRLDIIKKMLILEEDISIKSLAEQFYVSRATILSDLEWIKEWLAAYKLDLFIPQRRGIVTRGSEVSYRNAIAGYFDSCESVEKSKTIVVKKHGRFQEKGVSSLIKIYPEETVEKVKRVIEAAEEKYDFFLTEDYYTSLLTHLVISISRFIAGNTVPPEYTPPDDEEYPAFLMETAEYIARQLENVVGVKISDMERTYICIHLLGFNALSAEHSTDAEMPKEVKHLTLELIKAVDNQLDTHFSGDKLLFFGLCLHLKSKVFRLKKDVYYKKTSSFQLPDGFVDVYHAVSRASGLFREICGVVPDEDEILNISCYFLMSSHRNLHKYKVLLICNDGIVERMELMDLIESALPAVVISDCCTAYQLKFMTISEYDFVISTETLEGQEKAVIDLSFTDANNYIGYIADCISKMNL